MTPTPEFIKKVRQAASVIDDVALYLSGENIKAGHDGYREPDDIIFKGKTLRRLADEWEHKVLIDLMIKDLTPMLNQGHTFTEDEVKERARTLVEDFGWRPGAGRKESDDA